MLDEDDLDVFGPYSWHIFTLRPTLRRTASRKEVRLGREFRILLHRAVAVRVWPDLIEKKRRFRVTPKNGDYLDCRRENLEITVLDASKRGRKALDPRPTGYRRVHYRSSHPRGGLAEPSVLWSGGYEYRRFNHRKTRCIDGRPIR